MQHSLLALLYASIYAFVQAVICYTAMLKMKRITK
eukprot:COSAG01_NODE_490_length_16356_cov_34.781898_7_plen_35_part_00